MRTTSTHRATAAALAATIVVAAASSAWFDPPTSPQRRGKALTHASAKAVERLGDPVIQPAGPGSYATGFEFPEGFTPGYVDTQAGWTVFAASLTEAHIDESNPNDGHQHLRISYDPANPTGTFTGGFSPNLGPQVAGPVLLSIEVAISADGGADYQVTPQSLTEGLVATRVIFHYTDTDGVPDGLPNIWVLDDTGGGAVFIDTGANWIPDGVYRNLTLEMDPIAGSLDYYYDGVKIYSNVGGMPFAQTVEEVVIFSDNFHLTDDGDFDDLVLRPVGDNELALQVPPDPCETGGTIEVEVWMHHLTSAAAGYQAFLTYDDSILSYDGASSSYTTLPFPLHVQPLLSAEVAPGEIRIDGSEFLGGTGTSDDALLATLVFDVIAECDATGIAFDLSQPFDSELSFEGTPILTTLVNTSVFATDLTPPVFTTFPLDLAVECDESTEPGIPYGVADGGVAIYYNATGPEAPDNQAFLKAQFDGTNDPSGGVNGAALTFDDADLAGIPGLFSWDFLYGQVGPPGQFGLDFVLPAPTNDGSVLPPTLLAYDNGDNSIPGRILVGPVTWAINDYKGSSDGPDDPANDIINSIVRGASPGDPLIDVEITQLELTGGDPIFVADFAGKLVSDGLHHWYTPGVPASPMSNFGLDGEFFFAGILSYDSTGDDGTDRIDYYSGSIAITANSPNTDVGFPLAIDNCTLAPFISYSDEIIPDVGGCTSIFTILRTWRATDECGNFVEAVQTIDVVDTTAPEMTPCPDDIVVNADAGECTAVVTWTPPTATDNCELDILTSTHDPGDVFPLGITTVTYIAKDCAGNATSCDFDIEVLPVNTVDVTVDLVGSLPTTRCVQFVNGADCDDIIDVVMTFIDHDADVGTPVRGTATIEIACGVTTSLCAKDQQHTKWDDVLVTDLGTTYVADVHTLRPGDTDDDGDVDINDVTYLVLTFGDLFAPGGCPWDGTRDADFNNDGAVGSPDYSLQTAEWLTLSSCACAGLGFDDGIEPKTSVDTSTLEPWIADRVDLDANDVFDHNDVALFERMHGLPDTLSTAIRDVARARR